MSSILVVKGINCDLLLYGLNLNHLAYILMYAVAFLGFAQGGC